MAQNGVQAKEARKGGDDDPSPAFQKLLQETIELKENLRLERSRNADADLGSVSQKEEEVSLISPVMAMKVRKILKGHRGRVLHFDWSADKSHIITAGQDGHAVVWDAFTPQKEVSIQNTSSWILACSYAPSTTLVACGGTDNECSIYKLSDRRASVSSDGQSPKITVTLKTLATHSKYITNCIFFGSDQQLLTSSADTLCGLWDMELKEPVQLFQGHKMEVLGLATNPREPYTTFASGSSDRTACVWDTRSGQCVMKFDSHESDVNAVRFFPTGEALGTACNDGTIHLFDLRADQKVKCYTKPSILFGASALDFSKSGRIVFAGYDDFSIRGWDVLKGNHLMMWLGHQDRISHIQLSPDGTALGSSSWDGTMKIWA